MKPEGYRYEARAIDHRCMHFALAILFVALLAPGCSREGYRTEADEEAYGAIAERNRDPRWSIEDYSIEVDPRSRFFDKYDQDKPPMPEDDPESQRYMEAAHGIDGWAHWKKNGVRDEIENPAWREALAEYVELDADGAVLLNVDSALKLAYLHSPLHQSQLETLYLSALDVTRERFRLSTQFFAGYNANYTHTDQSETAAIGRLSTGSPPFEARRMLTTGGELLAGFANAFVWELGSNPNFSASLFNFALFQPLLRGAGKDVALEQLTLAERNLLGNLRAYSQFRQGFYTQVVIGDLGVSGPQRFGSGVNVQVSRSRGFVDGYLGLLQQRQRVRNTEDNLDLQLRTLAQLEANLEAGLIDLVQVDQFRQNIENERANLLFAQNQMAQALDDYKTGTLGLPPDLPIRLDDRPIRQFQFVATEASQVQDYIAELQARIGALPDDGPIETLNEIIEKLHGLLSAIAGQFDRVSEDLDSMDRAVAIRETLLSEQNRSLLRLERKQLRDRLSSLLQQFGRSKARVNALRDSNSMDNREENARSVVVLLGELLREVQGSVLLQARARLETISVDSIDLDSRSAFDIALTHRLDFMNARAALVDIWRSIQIRADALQSELNLTASGDIRTSGDSAVEFGSPSHSLQLGLEFDSPFTRLVERNNYRESLINYQRGRRTLIQSRDSLHLGLRALLREIGQLRTNIEIQRRAVVIAIRRVDLTRAELYAPVRPPQPGQRPTQFGPTSAINLLSALSSLRDTQNRFLGAWLSYSAARLRLFRELGVMRLEDDGNWIEERLPQPHPSGRGDEPTVAVGFPPPVPGKWIDTANAVARKEKAAAVPSTAKVEPENTKEEPEVESEPTRSDPSDRATEQEAGDAR